MMAYTVLWILVVVASLCDNSNGYKNGAPIRHCIDGMPEHDNSNPRTEVSGKTYTITTSSPSYALNQAITITISGSKKFDGFLLAVMPTDKNSDQITGTFTVYDTTKIRAYSWYSTNVNCLTHNDELDDTSLTVTWQAPAVSAGNVIIRATLVPDFEEIYIVEKQLSGPPVVSTPYSWAPSSILSVANFIVDSECGTSKGCILWPKTCTGSDCDVAVTYKTVGTDIDFELVAMSSNYISLSFSGDKRMGADETITCVYNSASDMQLQHGYNVGYWNARIQNKQNVISTVNMTKVGSKVYCKFRRPLLASLTYYDQSEKMHDEELQTDPTSKVTSVDLSKNSYYIFIGWGDIYSGQTSIKKHVHLPVITQDKINFQAADKVYANAIPAEIQSHATLMITAWCFIVDIAGFIAMFCKNVFSKPVGGIKLWFQLHRGAMVTVAVMSSASFILIFVYVDGFTTGGVVHAAFGIGVMVLLIAQIVGALLRPDPGTKHRPKFYWFHRTMAGITFSIAYTAVFLGVNITFLPDKFRLWQTIIFGVWIGFHFIFYIAFGIIDTRLKRKKQSAESDLPGLSDAPSNTSSTGQLTIQEKSVKENYNPLLILFVVFVVVDCIFLIVSNVYIYSIF